MVVDGWEFVEDLIDLQPGTVVSDRKGVYMRLAEDDYVPHFVDLETGMFIHPANIDPEYIILYDWIP